MNRIFYALAGLCGWTICAAGCSGSSFGSASLAGAAAFSTNVAVADSLDTTLTGKPKLNAIGIVLAEANGPVAQLCATAPDAGQDNVAPVSELAIALRTLDGTDVVAGTYTVVAPNAIPTSNLFAEVGTVDVDAGSPIAQGQGGSVTLTETGSTYTGTFTTLLVLPDGGAAALSGTFNAPYCQ